jgi:hypothetical protein
MKVIVKGSFDRDISKVRNKALRLKLSDKITQIESAKDISCVTGVKLFRGIPITTGYQSKLTRKATGSELSSVETQFGW